MNYRRTRGRGTAVKPLTAVTKRLDFQKIAVAIVCLMLVLAALPIATIKMFTPIYAATAEKDLHPNCLLLAHPTQSGDVVQSIRELKCKKAILWAEESSNLRELTVSLESKLSDVELVPEYGIRSEVDLCKSLQAEKQEKINVLGPTSNLIKLAYACEAAGVSFATQTTGELDFFTQYRHGVQFWGLVWQVNLQA